MKTPSNFPSREGAKVRYTRHLLRSIAFVTALGCAHTKNAEAPKAATAAETHAEQQERFKVDPYGLMRGQFFEGIDPGPVTAESPFVEILDELPYLYHADTIDLNSKDPSSSKAYELADLALGQIRGEREIIAKRKLVLEKLVQAAQSNPAGREAMMEVYLDNEVANDQLALDREELEQVATQVLAEVKRLTDLEKEAAAKYNWAAPERDALDMTHRVPRVEKAQNRVNHHRVIFKTYPQIQSVLQPKPLNCDDVSEDETAQVSDKLSVEAPRNLKKIAEWKLEAAMQRRESYMALQTYIELNPEQAQELKKYDGSEINDQLIEGWKALLKTQESHETTGLITELFQKSVLLAKRETRIGEKIGRCAPEMYAVKSSDGEFVASRAKTAKGAPTQKQAPKSTVLDVTGQTFEAEVMKEKKKLVLVEVGADWCQPCVLQAPILDELAADMGEDLKVVKIDRDRNPELAAALGVRVMPTMILLKKGKPLEVIFGGPHPLERLKATIKPHLSKKKKKGKKEKVSPVIAEASKASSEEAITEITGILNASSKERVQAVGKMISTAGWHRKFNSQSREQSIALILDFLGQHHSGGDYTTVFVVLRYLKGETTQGDREHIMEMYGHEIE